MGGRLKSLLAGRLLDLYADRVNSKLGGTLMNSDVYWETTLPFKVAIIKRSRLHVPT